VASGATIVQNGRRIKVAIVLARAGDRSVLCGRSTFAAAALNEGVLGSPASSWTT
jgi:hypothetical protein